MTTNSLSTAKEALELALVPEGAYHKDACIRLALTALQEYEQSINARLRNVEALTDRNIVMGPRPRTDEEIAATTKKIFDDITEKLQDSQQARIIEVEFKEDAKIALPHMRGAETAKDEQELAKQLLKLLTPINVLIGAVRSSTGLSPDSNITGWVDNLLKHNEAAREAVDKLSDFFFSNMQEQQPEQGNKP